MSAAQSLQRRLGRFSIPIECVERDPDVARTMLEGCIVVRAESIWHMGTIDYVAMHAEFEPRPPGQLVTNYRCELTLNADGSATRVWVKEL